jgi:periplasmic protein TonB
MPHALLLSPDDQAVSAITGVLEEMSVSCERPLDGVSAAQKLNSQSFDLVLVDCENLPAAKLIFDVCRRGKNGHNPVPIAIVDGRAGLPTAFRLGAELILTKPVAKDQARSTIRTAVSRLRKDAPANESVPAQPASAAMSATVMPEEHALAAAAAVSSQLTSFAEPAPSFVAASAATATLSVPALTTKMHSVVDEEENDAPPATPKLKPTFPSLSASSLSESPSVSEPSSARAVSAVSEPRRPVMPSDDPVLAELEEAELKEAELKLKGARLDKAAPDKPVADPGVPVFSSYQQSHHKRRSPLGALLMLALAGGGFYAAWMYQPGFRASAEPQIDRILDLAGIAHPAPISTPTPIAVKSSSAGVPATTPTPPLPADPTQTLATIPTTSVAATGSVAPASTPTTAVAAPASATKTPPAPAANKPEASKSSDKKDAAAATSSDAQLPGEKSAIILSSKGAEKRLDHSVTPKYPVEANLGDAQGTVVLKEVVDENGKVEGVRLVEGNAALATAAINAVKQWRYRPYVRDGKAQTFQTVVILDFQRP